MSTLAMDVKRRTPVEISLSRVFLSLCLLFLGCALCLSAVGLWLAHGSHGVYGTSLMKLWISVLLFVSGLFFVRRSRNR